MTEKDHKTSFSGLVFSHYVGLSLLGITVFSLLYQGIYFGLGASDHSIHIPYVKFFNDPQLFPHDLLVQSAPLYFTFFWRLIALAANFLPLKILFNGLHVLLRFSWVAAVYYLARAWALEKNTALLAVSFLVLPKVFFNFSPLSAGLVHSEAAWPLLIIALAAFFGEKHLISSLLLGLTFNLHPLLTTYLLLIILCLIIFQITSEQQTHLLRSLPLYGGIFLLCALPTLIWMGKATAFTGGHPAEWEALNLVRHKHFSLPGAWGTESYLSAGLLIFLFFIGIQSRPTSLKRRFTVFSGAILAMLLVGFPLFAWQHTPFLLKAQFNRAFLFLYFPGLLFFAGWLYDVFEGYEGVAIRFFIYLSALGLVFYGPHSFTTNLTLFAGGLIPLLGLLYYFEKKPLYLITCLVGILITLLGLFNTPFNVDWLLVGGMIGAALLLCFFDYFRERRRPAGASLVLLILLVSGLVAFRMNKIQTIQKAHDYWKDTQMWAKNNTSQESVFITPPAINGWHVFSERGNVLDWKSLTSIHWAPATAGEWVKRLKDFGYDLATDADKDLRTTLQNSYRNFNPTRFKELGTKYQATYVVTAYPQPALPFQLLFQNSTYRIYKLPG